MLMSAILMLRYLDYPDHAERIEKALLSTFRDGVKTPDIGGSAGTKAFTRAVIQRLGF
jgi:isocitrate/isopropylmalate dehydrogenase